MGRHNCSMTNVQRTGTFLLCLKKHLITKTFGGEKAELHRFLISAPDVEMRAGFAHGPIYSRQSNSLLICSKLCRPNIRSGRWGEATNLLPLSGIETRFLSPSPIHYSLYRLDYCTGLYKQTPGAHTSTHARARTHTHPPTRLRTRGVTSK
jgi:hypothetical protein